MALNFPNSPTNGQIYYDSSSGNRYVYDSANTIWSYASNTSLLGTTNTEILFNNQGAIDGSGSLVFENGVFYTDDIGVTNNVTAQYYFGNGSFLTGITASGVSDLTPANNWANSLSTIDRAIANAAANSANAYTVTVGAAGNNYMITIVTGVDSNATNNSQGANGWANSLSTIDRAIANAGANSANAYAGTLWTNALINGNNSSNSANAYAVTLWSNALLNANNDANSANAYAGTLWTNALINGNNSANSANAYAGVLYTSSMVNGNSSANSANAYALTLWTNALINGNNSSNSSNVFAMTYANGVANSANAGKVTSVTGTAGQIFSSGGTTPTLNLVNTSVVSSTYGSATVVPVITVDGQGRLTYAANVAISASGGSMDYAYVNAATVSANSWANTKLSNTSGVSFAGDLYFPAGNVTIGGTTTNFKLQVYGSFAANTKSFVIDHPTKEGMKLRYGSLEGPENGVYVRGRSGGSVIYLPDYWVGLVDESTITVTLTPYGRPQNLYVSSVNSNMVYVSNEDETTPTFYYHVYAERKDVEKLIVEF